MMIVFDKGTIIEILANNFSSDHIKTFFKGMKELRRTTSLGDTDVLNYLITGIEGVCWEGQFGDCSPMLTIKFEYDGEGTYKTIRTPYSFESLPITRNLYDKIMSLGSLTIEERRTTVVVFSRLIDQILERFYSFLNAEPGVNIVEIYKLYLEGDRLAISVGV